MTNAFLWNFLHSNLGFSLLCWISLLNVLGDTFALWQVILHLDRQPLANKKLCCNIEVPYPVMEIAFLSFPAREFFNNCVQNTPEELFPSDREKENLSWALRGRHAAQKKELFFPSAQLLPKTWPKGGSRILSRGSILFCPVLAAHIQKLPHYAERLASPCFWFSDIEPAPEICNNGRITMMTWFCVVIHCNATVIALESDFQDYARSRHFQKDDKGSGGRRGWIYTE